MEKKVMQVHEEKFGNLISAHERLLETERKMEDLKSRSEYLLSKFTREPVENEEDKLEKLSTHHNLVGLFDSVNERISHSMDETAMNINRVMEMID